MKKTLLFIILFTSFSFAQDKSDCDERSIPYYSINSSVKGENIAIRKAFKKIQNDETNILPNNGFITLRLHISKTGGFCKIETFEIDKNYMPTEFNNGSLVNKLKKVAVNLSNWERDKNKKTFNLIRFKIKNGKIEEIF
ncbi:MAG: hypothetical protein L3J20_06095 [Flavobacteriaceae bacterium]|nr:hypothetical protein [Flavobacteriaceae bacterium]